MQYEAIGEILWPFIFARMDIFSRLCYDKANSKVKGSIVYGCC